MSSSNVCLKCADTGFRVDGTPCDCGCLSRYDVPLILSVPQQYQGIRFNKNALPSDMQCEYGVYMERLYNDLINNRIQNTNLLICAPPNSGKTIFAYSLYAELISQGKSVSELVDLFEVRDYFQNLYSISAHEQLESINHSDVVFIKIPQDLPNKFPEIISTVIERRVRAGGITIFLYSGSQSDLEAQDRFGKLKAFIGDGSFNSLKVYSWERKLER